MPQRTTHYPVLLRELPADEGGGWYAEVPDLPGCAGDGETREAAFEDAQKAIAEWIAAAKELGRDIPEPDRAAGTYSGKWVQRLPKSLHARLARAAKAEGVSLNALATALIAEGLGQRSGNAV